MERSLFSWRTNQHKMKKIFALILFMISALLAKSQLPVKVKPWGDSVEVNVSGVLKGRIVIYNYPDTATANNERVSQYPYSVICTPTSKIWIRNYNATAWIEVGPGGNLVSNVSIVDSNHIQICNVNGCTVIQINGINGPITNVTVINDTLIRICGSDIKGTSVIVNGNFTGNATGWTLGTGWVYNSNDVIHVIGNIDSLQQTGALSNGHTYFVTIDVGGVAGNVFVGLDAGGSATFNAATGTNTFTGIWTTGLGKKIIIIPSTDFDGTVTNIGVQELLPNCDTLQVPPTNFTITDTITVITPLHGLDPHTIYIDTVDRTQDGVLLKEAYSYFDDKPEFLTHTAANGYDILQSVVHGDTTNWDSLNIVCDGLMDPAPQPYWAGITDSLVYGVTSGNYRLHCKPLTNQNTLFVLPPASPTLSYFATFYVDSSGNAGVIIGDSSLTPTIPPVDASYQILVTSLLVQPLQTVTDIDTLIIWDKNAHGNEFFVSNNGTTSDTTNTLNVYRFPRSINVTNINVGDRINFTHTVIDVSPYKALVLFIKLKQTIPAGAEIVANWLNGTTFVSGSIRLPINKSNITTYQPISIPLTTFSFTNTNITTLRLNYTNAGAANNLGFYLDFIYLQSGVTPALPSGVIVGYNGVTDKRVNGVDSIKLGGTLVENTTITEGPTFNLTLTGSQANGLGTAELVVNNSGAGKAIFANSIGGATITGQSSGGGTGLVGISASGIGTSGGSTDGVGVQGASINSLGGQFSVQPSSTNTTIPIARLNRLSSGTAANNIAGSLDLSVQTSDGTNPIVNQIITKLTTANTATRTSQLSFTGVNSATTNTLLTLSGNGAAQLNKYGLGNFTGTATYNLSVDASGNLIETTGGGGSTPTLQQVFNTESGGSILTKNDTILPSTHKLFINGSGDVVNINTSNSDGSGTALTVSSSGLLGNGIYSTVTTGISIRGSSFDNLAGLFDVTGACNSCTTLPVQIRTLTPGTAADGIGTGISFQAQTTASVTEVGSVYSKWVNATDGTNISEFGITGYDTTSQSNLLTLQGNGAVAFPKYGLGTFTGTPAYLLAVDASGNLIETSGGGGNTIYTGDGTYPSSAARTIDQNSGTTSFINGNVGIGLTPTKLFQVSDGSFTLIEIDKTGFVSQIKATDGTGFSFLNLQGDAANPSFSLLTSVADGNPNVNIYGNGNDLTLHMTAHGGITGKFVPRFTTDVTNTTPVADMDVQDMLIITALDADAAFGVPVGTLIQGESLLYRVTADGSPHNFTWDAVFQGGTQLPLPATISANETMYIQFVYNTESSKWQITGLTSGL